VVAALGIRARSHNVRSDLAFVLTNDGWSTFIILPASSPNRWEVALRATENHGAGRLNLLSRERRMLLIAGLDKIRSPMIDNRMCKTCSNPRQQGEAAAYGGEHGVDAIAVETLRWLRRVW
jgi:hypothetical protein